MTVTLEKEKQEVEEIQSIVKIGIASVRLSGKTNMFDRKQVMYYAFYLGFYETVSFLERLGKGGYLEYIESIDYDNCLHIPKDEIEYILEQESDVEGRSVVLDCFAEEVEEYHSLKGFNELKFRLGKITEI